MSISREPVMMYLCSTAYEHEVGHDGNGTTLYKSMKSLLHRHGCSRECGVVKVQVSFVRVEKEVSSD